MPESIYHTPHIPCINTSKIERPESTSVLPATLPRIQKRQSSQTYLPDPVRISQLPTSSSLLSGPALSPPPPTRFRTLSKRVPAYLQSYSPIQDIPSLQIEKTREARSQPTLPTILITTSPDLPKRKFTPQSPIHLRVNRSRHHGPKQLRDSDHRHCVVRDPSTSRIHNLRNSESSQHLRKEGARTRRGFGRRLIGPSATVGSEAANCVVKNRPTQGSTKPTKTERILLPSLPSLITQCSLYKMPLTPPSSPPLSPLQITKHSRSPPHSIVKTVITPPDTLQRPPTPPFINHDTPIAKRTTSGKMRWEDDRDTWF